MTPSLIWVRVVAVVVLLLGIVGAYLYVSSLRHENARLTQINSAQTIALTQLQTAMAVNQEVSDGYQTELRRLRARGAPARSVLQCPDDPVSVPAAAGGPDAAGPVALPGAAGSDRRPRDIGPELYALADDADGCAAQRDYLQEWIRRVTRTEVQP